MASIYILAGEAVSEYDTNFRLVSFSSTHQNCITCYVAPSTTFLYQCCLLFSLVLLSE